MTIDWLQDINTGEKFYPITHENAVIDSSGNTISTILSKKADKVSGATNGNLAGLDSNGNLTDSGKKASDFATAAQGTLAASAYQKPSSGIPSTDLSQAVQTSLGKADTALQEETLVEVTYGTTTAAQIDALLTDGKIPYFIEDFPYYEKGVVCFFVEKAFYGEAHISNGYIFAGGRGELCCLATLNLTTGSWSKNTVSLQSKAYFAQSSMSGDTTNIYRYPSTKAVADYVDGELEDVYDAIPTKTSELTNDSGYITSVPVTSVNGQTGAVTLSIPDAQIQSDWNQTTTTAKDYIKNKPTIPTTYAGSATAGGAALKTGSIPFGVVDSASTETVFTATVPGITELTDGTCVLLKNGVVTSATNFTININGLGAHPAFNNMTEATAETTIFNINYTMLFVYDSTRVVGNYTGAWCCYRGYNSDTNTIAYSVRSNYYSLPMDDVTYQYRLLFTSPDGCFFVPANTSSNTGATQTKTVNQTPIDPFGPIVYYSSSSSVGAGSRPSTSSLWTQYALNLRHSFNWGSGLTLTPWEPVYLKCQPTTSGSAIMDESQPIVQSLPTSEDGKIYIYLGVAYNTSNIELLLYHPVYHYSGGQIKKWDNSEPLVIRADFDGLVVDVPSGTYDNITMAINSERITMLAFPYSNGFVVAKISGFIDDTYIFESVISFGDTSRCISVFVYDDDNTDININDVSNINHSHGNITSAGALQTTDITIANGDKLVVTDASNSNKVARTSISFDGSTTTKALTKKGSFESFQSPLVSGSNIKTINGESILGSGNITISGGGVTSVNGYTGDVTIPTPPAVTSSDNDKILQVVNGSWSAVNAPVIYSGTSTPSSSLGKNGDIYIKTS